MWTVYLMLAFRKFALIRGGHPALAPGFFDVRVARGAQQRGEQHEHECRPAAACHP